MTLENQWQALADSLIEKYEDVTWGKMMSAPALQYNGKVFAFFYKGVMTFKLGKGYDIEQHGIHEYEHLAPFKAKPPMTAWFIVDDATHWQTLATIALETMQGY